MLLTLIKFKAADDFENEMFLKPLKKIIKSDQIEFTQVRSVYDYNPEIEQDDWNVFNSLFLLISIIIILLMLVFINCCTMLCDYDD